MNENNKKIFLRNMVSITLGLKPLHKRTWDRLKYLNEKDRDPHSDVDFIIGVNIFNLMLNYIKCYKDFDFNNLENLSDSDESDIRIIKMGLDYVDEIFDEYTKSINDIDFRKVNFDDYRVQEYEKSKLQEKKEEN